MSNGLGGWRWGRFCKFVCVWCPSVRAVCVVRLVYVRCVYSCPFSAVFDICESSQEDRGVLKRVMNTCSYLSLLLLQGACLTDKIAFYRRVRSVKVERWMRCESVNASCKQKCLLSGFSKTCLGREQQDLHHRLAFQPRGDADAVVIFPICARNTTELSGRPSHLV